MLVRTTPNTAMNKPRRMVKVAGVWKDVNNAWVKVNGVWRRMVWPPVYTAQVTLQTWQYASSDGKTYERRSAVLDGPNGNNYLGVVNQKTAVVNEETWNFRGIETGADDFGWVGPWKWVSIQWFGPKTVAMLNGNVFINGVRAELVDGVGGGDSATAPAFMTAKLPSAMQFPVGQPITVQF